MVKYKDFTDYCTSSLKNLISHICEQLFFKNFTNFLDHKNNSYEFYDFQNIERLALKLRQAFQNIGKP